MTDATLFGFSAAALKAAALARPVGQQKAKFCADVAAQLGTNAVFEIVVGTSTVVYRSTVTGALASSASGVALPPQFVEPPAINTANALTDANARIRLRSQSNPSIAVEVPVKAGGATGFLTASGALGGTHPARTSGVLLLPPAVLDATGQAGSGGSNDPGTLQAALRASMQNPPGRDGRVLQAFYEGFTENYPEFTKSQESGYTVQCFPYDMYGAGNTQFQPWIVVWEEATQAWGVPHVANMANRKVATHTRDWYFGLHYSDTDTWVISGPVQHTAIPDMFDGRIAAFQGAGVFPVEQRVTFSDGTTGARLVNESGITTATQVRCQHSWMGLQQMDPSRYAYLDAVMMGVKMRLEPIATTPSGASVGGTDEDVANARILAWSGVDHYPISFPKAPDSDALMAGRPTILTGSYQWIASWVKLGAHDQSWLDAHPVPL